MACMTHCFHTSSHVHAHKHHYQSLSLSLFLSLVPPLPVSITPDIEITATVGESVTLECHTSLPESLNGNIASINWTHNGAEVTEGVTNMLAQGESSLDLGTVISADAGTYICNVQIQSEFVDVDSHLIATNTTNLTIQCKSK